MNEKQIFTVRNFGLELGLKVLWKYTFCSSESFLRAPEFLIEYFSKKKTFYLLSIAFIRQNMNWKWLSQWFLIAHKGRGLIQECWCDKKTHKLLLLINHVSFLPDNISTTSLKIIQHKQHFEHCYNLISVTFKHILLIALTLHYHKDSSAMEWVRKLFASSSCFKNFQ